MLGNLKNQSNIENVVTIDLYRRQVKAEIHVEKQWFLFSHSGVTIVLVD